MPNYMLRSTYARLQTAFEEARSLLSKQPGIVCQAIESGGGTHDNAMYDSALHDQHVLAERVEKFSSYLVAPVFIDEIARAPGVVGVGTLVRVQRVDSGEEVSYAILGAADTEFSRDPRAVSFSAPLARQLLGKRVGDEVRLRVPAREFSVEILSVEPYREA